MDPTDPDSDPDPQHWHRQKYPAVSISSKLGNLRCGSGTSDPALNIANE
jgi:hypothetical protein